MPHRGPSWECGSNANRSNFGVCCCRSQVPPIANLKIVVKKCFMTRICFSLLLALLSEYFGAILDGPSKLVFKP